MNDDGEISPYRERKRSGPVEKSTIDPIRDWKAERKASTQKDRPVFKSAGATGELRSIGQTETLKGKKNRKGRRATSLEWQDLPVDEE